VVRSGQPKVAGESIVPARRFLCNGANLGKLLICFLALALPPAEAADSSRLVPLESGNHSNAVDRSFQVLFDQPAFNKLHRNVHSGRLPPPASPQVDFDRFVVVAAFMGQRSTLGYRIGFGDAVAFEGGTASLPVTERGPPPGTVQGQAITTPYAIAALARGDYKEVAFVDPNGAVLQRVTVRREECPSGSALPP